MTTGAEARTPFSGDAVAVSALLALSSVAWLVSGGLGDDGMRIGILTGSAADRHMADMAMSFGLFMGTWTVMMAAMMLPAVAPVVLTFRRWASSRGRPASTTAAFVTGYLLVWIGIGVAAYALLQALQEWVAVGNGIAVRVGAGLLVLTGIYQLTPLKGVCLRHCRSPLAIVMQYASLLGRGHAGPFRVGIVHGTYCVGCCWSLFVVLGLLGMMNLAWMGIVAAIVFAEKVLPHGRVVSVLVGLSLAGTGIVLLADPGAVPAIF